MHRSLKNRVHRLEDLAADGRADGYILAERVRHAAGDLPRDQWRFIRDQGFVPFDSAARAAHRLLNILLERPPPVTDEAYWLIDDIIWYLDNKRYWRPDEGWDVLWRFQRRIVPRLLPTPREDEPAPDEPAPDEPDPDEPAPGKPVDDLPPVPTAVLRDITAALTAHDPNYAPPFKPHRARRLPRRPKPYTRPEDCLPPSMRFSAGRRERPTFFEEVPYVEPVDAEPLW